MKKVVYIMTAFLSVVMVCILVIVGVLLINSPGKPEPFLDENGMPLEDSISEKVFVNIGGVEQGMFLKGRNVNNPVLLFVHGGPCFPEYFLAEKYFSGIEDSFTVCYWEERGGGLSYSPDVTADSLTMEQLESDTIEVTNYLRERFGREKVYLMAHSGGTTFAIQAAAKSPELYAAYIGVSQITSQAESEKIAYEYLMEQYKASGNAKMVKKLEKYPVLESDTYVVPFYKSLVRDQSMHELGVGTMHNMRSVVKDIFIPVMTCKAYTIEEKMKIWRSKFSFIKKTEIADQLFENDITEKVPKLEIPVYFLSGAYDLTVNYELSEAYLKQLQAPVKGFYIFHQSAHSPIFEESDKVQRILQMDVLAGENNLADTIH